MSGVNLNVTLESVSGEPNNSPDTSLVLRGSDPWVYQLGSGTVKSWYWAAGEVMGLSLHPFGTVYLRHNWAMLAEPSQQSYWAVKAAHWLKIHLDMPAEEAEKEVENFQRLALHKLVNLLYSHSPSLFTPKMADVFRRGEWPLGSVTCVSSPAESGKPSTTVRTRRSSRGGAGKAT